METSAGVPIYSLILTDTSRQSLVFSEDFRLTEVNSSGTFDLESRIQIYHGYVLPDSLPSVVTGTLYHDSAFEGTIKLADGRTLYGEAADKYSAWNKSYSIIYNNDDVYEINSGRINYPDVRESDRELEEDSAYELNSRIFDDVYKATKAGTIRRIRYR